MEHTEGFFMLRLEFHLEHIVEEAALTGLWLTDAEQVFGVLLILELPKCVFHVDLALDARIIRAVNFHELRRRLFVPDEH